MITEKEICKKEHEIKNQGIPWGTCQCVACVEKDIEYFKKLKIDSLFHSTAKN